MRSCFITSTLFLSLPFIFYKELVEALLLQSLTITQLPEATHTKLDVSLFTPRIFL